MDSSVVLDLVTDDPIWATWSETQLTRLAAETELCIDDMIYAECSVAFSRIEDFNRAIAELGVKHLSMPREALFLAAKAYRRYRARGGAKTAPLPDFFIGAHAAVSGLRLLTRDPRRVRDHFPTVAITSPQ